MEKNDEYVEMTQENIDRLQDENTADADKIRYRDSTYEIISKVAYLIGVPKRIFENEYESPKQDVFDKMEKDKSARIIRDLCILRTEIERNFKNINDRMKYGFVSILNMPEFVSRECINRLNADGVSFIKKSSTKLVHHLIEINRLINDRINNCKKFFPLWLNWNYVKDLFVMPDGLKETGTRAASEIYYANKNRFPYRMYLNWGIFDSGNILYNDKKFVTLLYLQNGDCFTEMNKVSDVSNYIKGSIYEFIDSSDKVVVVVDCENSDPYKLTATFRNLDTRFTDKISSIILFDDIHTVSAWRIMEAYTNIPVEHMMVERVKSNKSLVDIMLTTRTCQEHYKNNVDSFIIVSSDSDYWGLISSLPEARFLMMIERANCGHDLKAALVQAGIFYCYIDDFYAGNNEGIKNGALFQEMYRYIDKHVSLNVNDMLTEALRATRQEMTPLERAQFTSKYLKTMQMTVSDKGDIEFEFKRK